ncbi:hypothetical protein CENA302_02935, partial [Cylindrospermopsis raciborskii CENA302]
DGLGGLLVLLHLPLELVDAIDLGQVVGLGDGIEPGLGATGVHHPPGLQAPAFEAHGHGLVDRLPLAVGRQFVHGAHDVDGGAALAQPGAANVVDGCAAVFVVGGQRRSAGADVYADALVEGPTHAAGRVDDDGEADAGVALLLGGLGVVVVTPRGVARGDIGNRQRDALGGVVGIGVVGDPLGGGDGRVVGVSLAGRGRDQGGPGEQGEGQASGEVREIHARVLHGASFRPWYIGAGSVYPRGFRV